MNNQVIQVDNYIVVEPLINIVYRLKAEFPSHKLKDIQDKFSEIVLTCVNSDHADGAEKNPDAHINLDPTRARFGSYHCFSCGMITDFVGFIALYLDSSRDRAKQWLIKNYGILAQERLLIDEPISLNKSTVSNYLDESVLDDYQPWTPYLAQRKLSREVCKNFKVRYDPIMRQVIFPIYDIKGRLKMLAKRNIDTKFFHMDKDQEKEVYGLNIIQKNNIKSCMLVEGPIDLLTCWTHNIPAIATLGNISDYQIAQINKSTLNLIYIATDMDSAGERFAQILKTKLSDRILTERVILPTGRKDVNDLTNEEWLDLISKYNLN